MNPFSTVKGKVIAGVAGAAVAGGVVATVFLLNNNGGYRNIEVEELTGTTVVANEQQKADAYVGQHLVSGDDVSVLADSSLTLLLDADKHIYAEELTHFYLEADGNENDTHTRIYMDEGCNLFRIDDKLTEDEEFNVETPNASMSVRGTVFRVSLRNDDKGDKYTVVEVFEGEVYVACKMENSSDLTGEEAVLKAGETATIRSNTEISEFVKGADSKSITGIEYKHLPKALAYKLGNIIDSGRILAIEKNLLYDYVKINEHDFVEGQILRESTFTEHGYYYEVCEVCGEQGKLVYLPLLVNDKVFVDPEEAQAEGEGDAQPNDEVNENSNEKRICDPTEHAYIDRWSIDREPTCTAVGIRSKICRVCREKYREVIDMIPHEYGNEHIIKPPTVEAEGLKGKTCAMCGGVDETSTSKIDKLPEPCKHDYVETVLYSANCTSGGASRFTCSKCGESYEKSNPALGHSIKETVNIQATCGADGYKDVECTRAGCNYKEIRVRIPATGNHAFSIQYGASPAGGSHAVTCDVCGKNDMQACSYGGYTESGAATHARYCSVCNDEDSHGFVCSNSGTLDPAGGCTHDGERCAHPGCGITWRLF